MIYKDYLLLTKKSCPYCKKAEDLLDSQEIAFTAIDLESTPDILQQFKDSMEHQTVPIVLGNFGAGCFKLIGGFDDLKRTLVIEDD